MPLQRLLVTAVVELFDPLFQFFEYIIFLFMYKHLLFLSCFSTASSNQIIEMTVISKKKKHSSEADKYFSLVDG